MVGVVCRGKRTDNGEWVEGYYVHIGDYHYILTGKLDITNWYPAFEHYEVIPETVCRCTELHDTNGGNIFEGDVVRCRTTSCSFTGVVEYDKSFARYRVRTSNNSRYAMDSCFQYEILYNIHDSPELL